MKDYGKVTFEGKEYTLTQEAYYQAGEGKYMASAIDAEGNEYNVWWTITNPDAEEECDMCDWDEPESVEMTSESPVKVGATYEDPEGEWEITAVDGDQVTVKNIQVGNADYGHECIVSYDEARHYLNGGE